MSLPAPNMDIDTNFLENDEYGCPVFVMSAYHVKNFMKLFEGLQRLAVRRHWGAIKVGLIHCK